MVASSGSSGWEHVWGHMENMGEACSVWNLNNQLVARDADVEVVRFIPPLSLLLALLLCAVVREYFEGWAELLNLHLQQGY